MIILSLFLVLVVVGACTAVMYIFFKRLRRIEEELWGQKQKEAVETAAREEQVQGEQEEAGEA